MKKPLIGICVEGHNSKDYGSLRNEPTVGRFICQIFNSLFIFYNDKPPRLGIIGGLTPSPRLQNHIEFFILNGFVRKRSNGTPFFHQSQNFLRIILHIPCELIRPNKSYKNRISRKNTEKVAEKIRKNQGKTRRMQSF